MPRIFDNIDLKLLPDLQQALQAAYRADFCVGYSIRGWKEIASQVGLPGREAMGMVFACLSGCKNFRSRNYRVYIPSPRRKMKLTTQRNKSSKRDWRMNSKRRLTLGAPANDDEISLRKLAYQLKEKKVQVKLFLRHTLHAKLYLLFREDNFNPIIGYLGSSNLTLAGLSKQGELKT